FRHGKARVARSEPTDVYAALAPLLGPRFDEIIAKVYAGLQAGPSKSGILAKSGNVDGLKKSLKEHWEFVLSRAPDAETAKRARRVGDAHARVGLNTADYIDSYALFFK